MKRISTLLLFIFALSAVVSAQQTKVRRTITNEDLEKYRTQRLKTDPDDEKERRRLGLPSRETQEQERQRRAEETAVLSAKLRAREAQKQNYFQSQAAVLGPEIAAVQAEINYVRARLGEIPAPQTYYAVGYLPYSYGNFGGAGFPQQRVNTVQSNSIQIGGTVRFGGYPNVAVGGSIGQTTIRQRSATYGHLQAPRTNLYFGGIPYQPGILTVPFTLPTSQNLTREELLSRLRFLEQNRAGLRARWNLLKEEARQAGVRID